MKSWVEVSGAQLAGNFRAIQKVAGDGVEVLAVIKANAYGHSATLCAPLLERAGARWLGVSDCEEGVAVRAVLSHPGTRLLVMCGPEPDDAQAMVRHDLTPVVWTVGHIAAVEEAARETGRRMRVHLEIDSGMARQGIAPGEGLQRTLERLTRSEWVHCEGVLSHLCCAEEVAAAITVRQRNAFAAALDQVRAAGLHPELVHLGNSSAVDEGGTMGWICETARVLDAKPMVRTGLALYGYCLPLEGSRLQPPALLPKIAPVLAWKTRVLGVREIPAGATVGYGATFTATQPRRIALLPVGYADGFRRAASSTLGNGWVMIDGHRAPIAGRVSMNLITVDITGLDAVREGTEVLLLGEGVTANDHAGWSATIPYDILCGIRSLFHEVE